MNWERHKITAETAVIRGRGWLNLLLRLGGIGLLVIGALNLMLLGPNPILGFYREFFYGILGVQQTLGAWVVADFIAMAVGAIVAHFL